jgi:hypothetical protein
MRRGFGGKTLVEELFFCWGGGGLQCLSWGPPMITKTMEAGRRV